MPLYKIQSKKRLTDHDHIWSNDWYVNSASLSAATAMWDDAIKPFEVTIHYANVFFVEALISTFPTSDGDFAAVPVGLFGDRDTSGQDFMPLFNTARVDFFSVAGRPSPKYFRLPISEADSSNGVMSGGMATLFGTAIDQLFSDIEDISSGLLKKSTDVTLISGQLYGLVQMRQIHRKRKRNPAP